jgi:hypothetical protein
MEVFCDTAVFPDIWNNKTEGKLRWFLGFLIDSCSLPTFPYLF